MNKLEIAFQKVNRSKLIYTRSTSGFPYMGRAPRTCKMIDTLTDRENLRLDKILEIVFIFTDTHTETHAHAHTPPLEKITIKPKVGLHSYK